MQIVFFAFFFSEEKRVKFFEIRRLACAARDHKVAPHEPGIMCTAAPSVLVYEDLSGCGCRVRWLDCKTFPPKPVSQGKVLHTERHKTGKSPTSKIYEMSCAYNAEKQHLLIIVTTSGRLRAIDSKNGDPMWEVPRNLPHLKSPWSADGVTTDGCGHLFVSDTRNKSVHMFSTEGEHLQEVFGKEQLGPDKSRYVGWIKKRSSLVVVHDMPKQGKKNISVLKLDV